jgi:hypothetical protein
VEKTAEESYADQLAQRDELERQAGLHIGWVKELHTLVRRMDSNDHDGELSYAIGRMLDLADILCDSAVRRLVESALGSPDAIPF